MLKTLQAELSAPGAMATEFYEGGRCIVNQGAEEATTLMGKLRHIGGDLAKLVARFWADFSNIVANRLQDMSQRQQQHYIAQDMPSFGFDPKEVHLFTGAWLAWSWRRHAFEGFRDPTMVANAKGESLLKTMSSEHLEKWTGAMAKVGCIARCGVLGLAAIRIASGRGGVVTIAGCLEIAPPAVWTSCVVMWSWHSACPFERRARHHLFKVGSFAKQGLCSTTFRASWRHLQASRPPSRTTTSLCWTCAATVTSTSTSLHTYLVATLQLPCTSPRGKSTSAS